VVEERKQKEAEREDGLGRSKTPGSGRTRNLSCMKEAGGGAEAGALRPESGELVLADARLQPIGKERGVWLGVWPTQIGG
jgi:hypothetical protein